MTTFLSSDRKIRRAATLHTQTETREPRLASACYEARLPASEAGHCRLNQLSGSEPQTVGKLTMRVQTAQTTRSIVSEMVWQIEQGRDSAMPPRLLTRPKQRRCGVKSKVHMGRRASRAPGKAPARPSFSQIVRMTQASLSVNERSGDDQRRRALQSGLSRISGVPWVVSHRVV